MSERPLADAAARARIVTELDRSLLVEAGAGSGKTHQLAARMAAGIATGTYEIEHLAAVTFTRKAAAELRGRFQLARRAFHLARRCAQLCPQAENPLHQAFLGAPARFQLRQPAALGAEPLVRQRFALGGIDPDRRFAADDLQLVLQRLDGVRQRRLRDADALGGAGEAALLGDGHHVAQLP